MWWQEEDVVPSEWDEGGDLPSLPKGRGRSSVNPADKRRK